jgi:hypothetical protein
MYLIEQSCLRIQVCWDVTPCRLVNSFCLQGAYFLHLECWISLKALVRFAETSVAIYQSTRRNMPEHLNLHLHRCEIYLAAFYWYFWHEDKVHYMELPWQQMGVYVPQPQFLSDFVVLYRPNNALGTKQSGYCAVTQLKTDQAFNNAVSDCRQCWKVYPMII